jgi:hypothetical protein
MGIVIPFLNQSIEKGLQSGNQLCRLLIGSLIYVGPVIDFSYDNSTFYCISFPSKRIFVGHIMHDSI